MAKAPALPTEIAPTRTAFVYETRTGKVVHIHQFVPARPGGTIPEDEMEKAALSFAPATYDRRSLRVLHADEKLDLSPEFRYRVDVRKRALLAERVEPLRPRDRPRRTKPA